MTRWHEALRTYRRVPLEGEPADEPTGVMFVLCSENHAAAALIAACEPALVLQTFGGAREPADESTRAAFEYAIVMRGVRHVVVCGHQGCAAVASGDPAPRSTTAAAVVSQCVGLREDPRIGLLLRAHRVALLTLWFDVPAGDVFLCSLEDARVTLMDADDVRGLLARFALDKH